MSWRLWLSGVLALVLGMLVVVDAFRSYRP